MIGVIAHIKLLLDQGGHPITGPQVGVVAGSQRTGHQLRFLRLSQPTGSSRMRFGFEAGGTVLLFHRLPAVNRRGGRLDQTGYFVKSFTLIQQLAGQLTTVFQPIGTPFRSHAIMFG